MNTTSTTDPIGPTPDALPPLPPVTYTDEARIAAFVALYQLGEYVEPTIQLAREHFPRAKGISVCVDGYPGTDEERLMIDAAMGSWTTPAEAGRQFDSLIRAWSAATPTPVREWICFSQDLR